MYSRKCMCIMPFFVASVISIVRCWLAYCHTGQWPNQPATGYSVSHCTPTVYTDPTSTMLCYAVLYHICRVSRYKVCPLCACRLLIKPVKVCVCGGRMREEGRGNKGVISARWHAHTLQHMHMYVHTGHMCYNTLCPWAFMCSLGCVALTLSPFM